MIIHDNHIITTIIRKRAIAYVYYGAKLVWAAVNSCFGSGKWIGKKKWIGKDKWKGQNTNIK